MRVLWHGGEEAVWPRVWELDILKRPRYDENLTRMEELMNHGAGGAYVTVGPTILLSDALAPQTTPAPGGWLTSAGTYPDNALGQTTPDSSTIGLPPPVG